MAKRPALRTRRKSFQSRKSRVIRFWMNRYNFKSLHKYLQIWSWYTIILSTLQILTFLEPFMTVSRLMPNEFTFSLLEPKPNSLFNIKNKSRSSKTALQRCSRPSSQQKHQGGWLQISSISQIWLWLDTAHTPGARNILIIITVLIIILVIIITALFLAIITHLQQEE